MPQSSSALRAPRQIKSGGVYVFDTAALPWQPTGKPGLLLKPIRQDNSLGHYLGLVAFDGMVRSGLHQHLGVATSFFIAGALTDYHGSAGMHEIGINQKGATHDAIAYQPTVLVSRLEAPVIYPPEHGPVHGLHAGAHAQAFANPNPKRPPEINVHIDAEKAHKTGVSGVSRQLAFDYKETGDHRRMGQLRFRPACKPVQFQAQGLIELWVRGGQLEIAAGNRKHSAHANCFIVIEPGTNVTLSAPFGALAIAWAEADATPTATDQLNLFGF
jgi:hypothetical protein